MRIYLQLESWEDLFDYYPILKYIPNQYKLVIAKFWLKPIKIDWNTGPQLYILPISVQANYCYKIADAVILPQDEKTRPSPLLEALLVQLLPQLAKEAEVDFYEDPLLLNGFDLLGDARFLKQLVDQWRYIIVTGNSRLKIEWWKEYIINELGQVIQFRSHLTGVANSCLCNFEPQFRLSGAEQPKLYITSRPSFKIVYDSKTIDVFRINIGKEYPKVLHDIYGDFLPVAVIEEWFKTTGIYSKRLSKWVDIIRLKVGLTGIESNNDNIIYLKIT